MAKTMDIHEIVTNLVGYIEPVGETRTDDARFENLKVMTELVDKLIYDINEAEHRFKNNHQFSMKRASEFATKFLNTLGEELNS